MKIPRYANGGADRESAQHAAIRRHQNLKCGSWFLGGRMNSFHTAIFWLRLYIGGSCQIILPGLALLYLLLSKEERNHRRLFAGFSCIFAILYICPLTARGIMRCIGDNVYWRLLWVLPLPIITAYTGTRLYERVNARWKKAGLFVLMTGVICLTGKNVYLQDSPYVKAANMQKLPEEVAVICQIIREDAGEDSTPRIAVPAKLSGYIRQYDAGIEMLYGRRGTKRPYGKQVKFRLRRYFNGKFVNYKKLTTFLRKGETQYVVLGTRKETEKKMRKRGFEIIGRAGEYVIYKDAR